MERFWEVVVVLGVKMNNNGNVIWRIEILVIIELKR